MTTASLEKELQIITPNTTGMAGILSDLITKDANVGIHTLWGGVIDNQGVFSVITENNGEVINKIGSHQDFNLKGEQDVLVVRVPNTKGTCTTVAKTIGDAGLDINYIYTTVFGNDPAVVVSTTDNNKALSLFS